MAAVLEASEAFERLRAPRGSWFSCWSARNGSSEAAACATASRICSAARRTTAMNTSSTDLKRPLQAAGRAATAKEKSRDCRKAGGSFVLGSEARPRGAGGHHHRRIERLA